MTFANKYTEQHYILSDDHRKQVVLSDTREPRKYIANNTKHQRVIVYKVMVALFRTRHRENVTMPSGLRKIVCTL
jgi:hypothetical protein